MTEEKVSVKMNFCYNPIMAHHVHLSWEGTVLPGQKAEEVWQATIQRIEEFYKTRFPESQSEMKGTQVRDIEPVDSVQASLDEINKCTTLEELQHCWIMSKGNLTLSAAWKQKEKQLKW